jgi:LuxR family transcriptional regulator, maltose regulon positive regulatory protein
MPGIDVFTLRYFEALYSRFKPPFALVFDNYHTVHSESGFHNVMNHALSHALQGLTIICISRGETPPSFSRLRANNLINFVGWDELRFSLKETKEFVKEFGHTEIPSRILEELYSRTEGWAAGTTLLLQNASTGEIWTGFGSRIAELSQQSIFDYFASEILERMDQSKRDFLLKTAFFPKMTAEMGEKLTGNNRSGQILTYLNRENFFTEKHSDSGVFYQYHPLFRDFLLARAQISFSPEMISELRVRAAGLLEKKDLIEDAAALLIESGSWDLLIGIVLKHAAVLVTQGRFQIVENWLNSLPEELFERGPWLLYWKGVCRFLFNLKESQGYFEKAFDLFKEQKEPSGIYLAWAGAVDTFLYSFEETHLLDKWIDEYETLARLSDSLLPHEITARAATSMFTALVVRQPWRTDLDEWLDRALTFSNVNMKAHAHFHNIYGSSFSGGLVKAQQSADILHQLANSPDLSPFNRLMLHLAHIMYYNLQGPYALSRAAAIAGLEFADNSGAHLVDMMLLGNGIVAACNYGDYDTAGDFFERLPDPVSLRPWDKSFYYYIQALRLYLGKDFKQASLFSEQAFSITPKPQGAFFLSGILHAHILYELGEAERAEEFLEKCMERWKLKNKSHDAFLYYLTKAYFHLEEDQAGALSSLRNAMSIGKEEQCISVYMPWRPAAIGRLYETALEHGIEVEYVQQVIRKRNFIPDDPPVHVEYWPWPVKIHALGRFGLLMDERPVSFSGKIQKKPLEMLKVLLALGGDEIRNCQISDALWPDADGDMAGISLKTTLHRLRQLLGNDAIRFQDGRISLDRRHCWTDFWAFERLISEVSKSNLDQDRLQKLEKAVGLYKGHFLPEEKEKIWTVSIREILKRKYLSAIGRLGLYYEESGDFRKAIESYEKGLEVDDLEEEFYQGIMKCHLKNGNRAAAAREFERCKKVLNAVLEVDPSGETERLYLTCRRTGR